MNVYPYSAHSEMEMLVYRLVTRGCYPERPDASITLREATGRLPFEADS